MTYMTLNQTMFYRLRKRKREQARGGQAPEGEVPAGTLTDENNNPLWDETPAYLQDETGV